MASSTVRGWRSLVAGAVGYLVLSIGLWWNVWSTHPTSVTTCGCGDTSLFTWFLEWPAYAISHGTNPLYSTHLFHPGGINLLSNTAEVGLGIVLAPVTWLFGPIATLNVALTLSPALSALAMYVLLRRWVTWAPAAFLGGLLYGFSPFVLVSLTDAHLMLGMAAMPPVLVLCLDELFVRQRWRPWITGLAIGGAALIQFTLGTEVLVITGIAVLIGTAFLLVIGLFHLDVLAARIPYVLRGGVVAIVSTAALLAYPAWFALAGPAHLSGDVWGNGIHLSYGGNNLRLFVHQQVPVAAETALGHRFGGYQAPTLSGQYLGLGLLVVLLLGLVIWHRDLRLWLFAITGTVCAFFSLGLSFHGWTLWRLVVRAPLMDNVIPSRFGLMVYLCAAVMLGLVLDHAYRVVLIQPRPSLGRVGMAWGIGVAVACVALVPIGSYFADGLPLTTQKVELPEWFRTVAPTLPAHQVLLVFPYAFRQSNMTWQAVDHMSFAMVGGGGPNSLPSRAGKEREGGRYLSNVSIAGGAQAIGPGEVAAVRSAMEGWGVTGVVFPNPAYLPSYEKVYLVRTAIVLMTAATGQLPEYRGNAWVWRAVDKAPAAVDPGAAQLSACTAGPHTGTPASIAASAECILAPPAGS